MCVWVVNVLFNIKQNEKKREKLANRTFSIGWCSVNCKTNMLWFMDQITIFVPMANAFGVNAVSSSSLDKWCSKASTSEISYNNLTNIICKHIEMFVDKISQMIGYWLCQVIRNPFYLWPSNGKRNHCTDRMSKMLLLLFNNLHLDMARDEYMQITGHFSARKNRRIKINVHWHSFSDQKKI